MRFLLFFLLSVTGCAQVNKQQNSPLQAGISENNQVESPEPHWDILSKKELQKYIADNPDIIYEALQSEWMLSNILALLDLGADPSKEYIRKGFEDVTNTAMILAASPLRSLTDEDLILMKELYRHGAPINFKGTSEALCAAVYRGHLETVKFFVENGAYLYTNKNEKGPLHYGYIDGVDQPKITEYLLKKGVNPNSLDEGGYPPLVKHLESMNYTSAQLLLNYGADPFLLPEDYSYTKIIDQIANYYNTAKKEGIDFNDLEVRHSKTTNLIHEFSLLIPERKVDMK